METCDVVIVGGGPGGSACAWKLRRAGLDVVVMDAALFPRDKVCAGWITPQVVDDLEIDVDDYRRGRTFQPITGFRTGIVNGQREIDTVYDCPVSFGIRRCEFDHYLLQRSGARLKLGAPVSSIRRNGASWVLNEAVTASMLVGAGGHFCPIARMLGRTNGTPLVVAQEIEFALHARDAPSYRIAPEQPELYFCRDLKGYGWCFRKQNFLNVGFGRLDRHSLPKASAAFVAFLKAKRRIPEAASWRWRGHAYLVADAAGGRAVQDSALLVGDAAGVAYPQSGEGIRPAIESGLMAASTIVEANGRYSRDRLAAYEQRLTSRFGVRPLSRLLSQAIPPSLPSAVGPRLFALPWFVRHLVLDRWFLRAHESALARV